MRVSKYVKVDKNVLIEYIYDDGNLIGESYDISVNIKTRSYSFLSGTSSNTININSNTLFPIDLVTNTYGKFDSVTYPFLQVRDYSEGFPIRYDTIKVHLPINYTFGEYLGIYIRAYAFDSNSKTYDLSNFYFDKSDINQSNLLSYDNPPLYFQEKLWGKSISLDIPSLYAVSGQRTGSNVKSNTINYNLTSGLGLDQSTPLFIDFQFLIDKSTVNSATTYILSSKNTITLPQTPEFEKVGVMIEESQNGDFFEIYGIYNGTIGDFNEFMTRSYYAGHRYYVEYNITMYEQNIRGKSMRVVMTSDFLNKVEYRPIIKYSTTTAIIDVQMIIIDAVDSSQILRTASYGMLQDQVAKYSLFLMKINLSNAHKPKIYNQKNTISSQISSNTSISNKVIETIKVPYPVLIDKYNVVAKSDNVQISKDIFYGMGKIMITLFPFDNIVKFIIARNISNAIDYIDLTSMGEINIVIKNQSLSVEMGLYSESDEIDLSKGFVVFRILSSKMNDIKKIYDSGTNVFYITSRQQNISSVIYSGLFKMYDSLDNISDLNNYQSQEQTSSLISLTASNSYSDVLNSGTAIITRKVLTGTITTTTTVA